MAVKYLLFLILWENVVVVAVTAVASNGSMLREKP